MKRGGQPPRKHIIIGRDGAVGIVPFLLDCDKAQKKGPHPRCSPLMYLTG